MIIAIADNPFDFIVVLGSGYPCFTFVAVIALTAAIGPFALGVWVLFHRGRIPFSIDFTHVEEGLAVHTYQCLTLRAYRCDQRH